MMKITINGQLKEFPKGFEAPLNLYDVLAQEEVIGMMIAVAHNGNVIPKGNYTQIFINDGDQIEIVAPMQGG